MLVVFTALTARLYDLEIVHGDYYRDLAEQNRILRLPVTDEPPFDLDWGRLRGKDGTIRRP